MEMLNWRAPDHPAGRRGKQAMTSEPIKVEVVTMPARVTDVRVERNAAGDIVSTSHLEQDLPKKSAMLKPGAARGRLRQWQASRAWIPNRHAAPLKEVERLAESAADGRLHEAARETGNWPLLRCLEALVDESRRRKRKNQT